MKDVRFYKGRARNKKYTAVLPNGENVHFGDARYEQYYDSVPVSLGGGLWSHKNHLDKYRRDMYRKRHGASGRSLASRASGRHKIKYSPAWFSYHFLW